MGFRCIFSLGKQSKAENPHPGSFFALSTVRANAMEKISHFIITRQKNALQRASPLQVLSPPKPGCWETSLFLGCWAGQGERATRARLLNEDGLLWLPYILEPYLLLSKSSTGHRIPNI